MGDTTTEPFDPRSEDAQKLKEYPYYTARPVKTIDNSPAWDTFDIGVFEHSADGSETQLGSYRRNYRFLQTFWWFRRGSRHFALFSPDYTATRIMEIFPGDGFKDLGGEQPDDRGFCPVEFYVPDCRQHVSQEFTGQGETIIDWTTPLASLPLGSEFTKNPGTHRGRAKLRGPDGKYLQDEHSWIWGEEQDYESGWIKYPPDHGFVAGCLWGDDSSSKIQYLDLSRVEEGIVQRRERFGYIELPRSVALRDSIHIYGLPDAPRVHIAISTEWDLKTDKMKAIGVAPWDEE
jgi:hypothetical protein